MAKFYGAIGFAQTIEDPPDSGNAVEQIIEKKYYGDLLQNSVRNENGEYLNSNLNISNEISIVADSFLYNNSYAARYVRFLGAMWEIRNITINYPRLILSIGGVYNGKHGPSEVPAQPAKRTSLFGKRMVSTT